MTSVRRILSVALVVGLAAALFAGGWLVGRLGIGSVVEPASLTEAERQFTERMRDVSLVGSFTIAGREVRPRLREDVGMEIDREHYLTAGAGGGGTGITCPHFLQVRSDSSA